MKAPKFSILTPVYLHSALRKEMFDRSIRSIINQTYPDFEHIIVNDGSRIPFKPVKDPRQIILEQPHLERIIGLNAALKKSTGEWICFSDSDDEYLSVYLETVNKMIEAYPKYKVFNFGSIHVHRDYNVTLKAPYRPKKLEVGHEIFKSGNIVNGTFVFHRSCYEKLGGFPNVTNPWDFAKEAFKEFPEIKELYALEDGRYRELGNPWGNDWFMFYKLTRKYHSLPVSTYLYVVLSRLGQENPIALEI